MSRVIPQFEKLPGRITLSVFGGNLLISVCIAFVLGFSVFRDLRHQAETKTLKQLEKRSRLIDTFLQELVRSATEYRFIEHSFKMKTDLGRWWEEPRVPLSGEAIPDIARVDLSLVKGMVRYGVENQGSPLPAGVPGPVPFPRGDTPVLHTLFYVEDSVNLSIVFPVTRDSDGNEGVDIVVCDASELQRMLVPSGGFKTSAHLSMYQKEDETIRFLTPPLSAEADDGSQPATLVQQALDLCIQSISTSWAFVKGPDGHLAIGRAPLSPSGWGLMVVLPRQALYKGVLPKTILLGIAAVLLALFISSFSLVVVRPFITFFRRMDHLLGRERVKRHRDNRRLHHCQWLLEKANDFTTLCCSIGDSITENSENPEENLQHVLADISGFFAADMVFMFETGSDADGFFLASKAFETEQLSKVKADCLEAFSIVRQQLVPDISRKRPLNSLDTSLQALGYASYAGILLPIGGKTRALLICTSRPGVFQEADVLRRMKILGALIAGGK